MTSARQERCSSSSSHVVCAVSRVGHPGSVGRTVGAVADHGGMYGRRRSPMSTPTHRLPRAGAPVPGRGPAARSSTATTDDAAMLDLGVQDTGPDGAALGAARSAGRGCRDGRPGPRLDAARGAARLPADGGGAGGGGGRAVERGRCRQADLRPRLGRSRRPGSRCSTRSTTSPPRCATSSPSRSSKGEMSGALTERLDAPYLRWCNPCQATHIYEQPFRLVGAAGGPRARAGHVAAGAAPDPAAGAAPAKIGAASTSTRSARCCASSARSTPKLVAAYVDSPVPRGQGRAGPRTSCRSRSTARPLDVLADDLDALVDPPVTDGVRLLGPFDLFLQCRDRELVHARRRRPQGPLAHPRPARGRAGRRTRSSAPGDRAARARSCRLAVTVWDGGERAGRSRPSKQNAWPRSAARRSHGSPRTELRSARGSAPCPGRRRRTW